MSDSGDREQARRTSALRAASSQFSVRQHKARWVAPNLVDFGSLRELVRAVSGLLMEGPTGKRMVGEG